MESDKGCITCGVVLAIVFVIAVMLIGKLIDSVRCFLFGDDQPHEEVMITFQGKLQQDVVKPFLEQKRNLHNSQKAFRQALIKNAWTTDETINALSAPKTPLNQEPWFSDVKEKWDEWQKLLSISPVSEIEKTVWELKKQIQESEQRNEWYSPGTMPELDKLIKSIESKTSNVDVMVVTRQTLEAIPRLKMTPEELPELPSVDHLFNGTGAQKDQPVLERVQNVCSKEIEKAKNDADNYIKKNQFEAACFRQLDAIAFVRNEINKLDDKSFQKTSMELLDNCQSRIKALICRPYRELIHSNKEKLKNADSDQVDELWEQILNSLEDIEFIYPEFLKEDVIQQNISELNQLLEYFEKDQKERYSYVRGFMSPFIEKLNTPSDESETEKE